jgi:hypothetical protein
VIILVHYAGPVLYIPAHRFEYTLEYEGKTRQLGNVHGVETSELLRFAGDDLQINGSGYFQVMSQDAVELADLGSAAKLKITIRFRSDSGVTLTVDLQDPDWRFAEPGIPHSEWQSAQAPVAT